MMRSPFASRRAFVCLVVLMLPIGAWAELPDPLDAEAATPALDYQSPLNNYRSMGDEPMHDWREANELVGRIGGWRTYAQEPWEQTAEQETPAESGAGGQHDHH